MSKSISKSDLEAMLAEAQAKNASLTDENTKLRMAVSKRPSDALVISTNLVFQKGTHKDLVGKTLKLSVPQEALGALHISGTVKLNTNGNAYIWATGYIDTSKLSLESSVVKSTDTEKATKSFKDSVVG
jgi:hypothetical protein